MQYKRIVTWLESESALGEEDEQKAKALRLAAHLNLAMCYLKIQEAAQALENCDKVFFTALHGSPYNAFGDALPNASLYCHWTRVTKAKVTGHLRLNNQK